MSETIFGITGTPIPSRSGKTIATGCLSSSATLTSSVSVSPILACRLVRLEHAAVFQNQRAYRFIGPEDVGLGIILFGEQAVGESGALSFLSIEDGVHLHTAFLFVGFQDRFGEHSISRDVDCHLAASAVTLRRKPPSGARSK